MWASGVAMSSGSDREPTLKFAKLHSVLTIGPSRKSGTTTFSSDLSSVLSSPLVGVGGTADWPLTEPPACCTHDW